MGSISLRTSAEGGRTGRELSPYPRRGNEPGGTKLTSVNHSYHGAKYPLMSMITFVGSLTKMLIAPSAPAGTMAALARIAPLKSFSVETPGIVSPVGQVIK